MARAAQAGPKGDAVSSASRGLNQPPEPMRLEHLSAGEEGGSDQSRRASQAEGALEDGRRNILD